MIFGSSGADQREADRTRNLVLGFRSEEGFGFGVYLPDRGTRRIADQREARTATDHALAFCWRLGKSLRLARCISRAASVSDWFWAKRSSSASVTFGRR
jgi:hypothetical protein